MIAYDVTGETRNSRALRAVDVHMDEVTVSWVQDGLLLMVRQGGNEILLLPGDARELTASLLTRLNEQPESFRAEIEAPDGNAEEWDDDL
jgi:hypothetical protein